MREEETGPASDSEVPQRSDFAPSTDELEKDIELGPGEYWLMVWPITFGCGGGWFLGRAGTTYGANGVGGPLGDGRSYFNGYGRNFVPTSDVLGAGTWDFSYGVQGVPEPMTWMALGTGIAVLLGRRRVRKS